MIACTFFGHKDTPKTIKPMLRSVLIDLIKNKNVSMFYVGNHGSFDAIVKEILSELKNEYSFNYSVVLAYIPTNKNVFDDFRDTVCPDGIECVPHRYRINYRNKWMLKKSDYVVTYVKYIVGGAAYFKDLAQKQGKMVLNLVEF
jgi:uncharacterized phage-like protein YoqJ